MARVLDNRLAHQRWLLHIAIGLLPFVLALALWPFYRIVFDATGSLGGGLFLVVVGDTELQRNDLAVFHPPANRFFAEQEEFIKQVGGVPGDLIRRESRSFFNGATGLGTAKTVSRHGDVLQAFAGGLVPAGHFYFYSAHPDAFDSRYQDIGFVARERVIGQAYRIF